MSEIQTNINLQQIQAPDLTSTRYGRDIKEQFENIDNNFRRVSNCDFVKGTSGANIRVTDLSLYDSESEQFTSLGIKMINKIADETHDWNDVDWTQVSTTLQPVTYIDSKGETHVVYFYDYIKRNPNITVIYTLIDVESPDKEENRDYICSTSVYTFLDQRYANVEELGGINEASFVGREDKSCLLTLKYDVVHSEEQSDDSDDSEQQKQPIFSRSNLFPTLYYENGEFKWKIYGNETGIRAMGPKGDPGSSTSVWLVRISDDRNIATSIPNPNLFPIIDIAVTGADGAMQWVSVSSASDTPKQGDVCIALKIHDSKNTQSGEYVNDAFISPAVVYDSAIYVTATSYNAINQNLVLNQLMNELLSIGSTTGVLGGLFIPYFVNSNPAGVHFFYHTTDQSLHKLHITPKVPISSGLNFSNPTANKFDENSEIDIEYEFANINSKKETKIKGEKGSISIGKQEGAEIKTTTYPSPISGDSSVIGVNLDITAGGNLNIKNGIGHTSENYNVNLNIESKQDLNLSSGTKINIEAGSETNIKAINDVNIISDKGSVNVEADRDITIHPTGDLILQGNHIRLVGSEEVSCDQPVIAKVNGKDGNGLTVAADVYLGCPIGTIVMWPTETAPDNWLLCQGQNIELVDGTASDYDFSYGTFQLPIYKKAKEDDYRNLTKLIWNIWGSRTILGYEVHLPNFQQNFPLGATVGTLGPNNYSTQIGETGGEAGHTLVKNEMPVHSHDILHGGASNPDVEGDGVSFTRNSGSATVSKYESINEPQNYIIHETGGLNGVTQEHNNIPPFLAINFIIKYK